LPKNIFYGTSIPTCILVFKKCRVHSDDIFFIDASQGFEKQKNQNYLRDKHINKIIDTLKNRKNIDKYSYVAELKEIEENDFNLNIPRYVDTFEEEELIDLDKVSSELKSLENEIKQNDKIISDFCKELGISEPF
jgi:type I restriction enzyme M protein